MKPEPTAATRAQRCSSRPSEAGDNPESDGITDGWKDDGDSVLGGILCS